MGGVTHCPLLGGPAGSQGCGGKSGTACIRQMSALEGTAPSPRRPRRASRTGQGFEDWVRERGWKGFAEIKKKKASEMRESDDVNRAGVLLSAKQEGDLEEECHLWGLGPPCDLPQLCLFKALAKQCSIPCTCSGADRAPGSQGWWGVSALKGESPLGPAGAF